jgi:GH25 family lysozyme M1 (1,4-beta-N-acetylmuramidase)
MSRNRKPNLAIAWAVEALEERVLMARALGIDISSFQPTVDWTAVKNSGRSFAWAKATEGFTFNDSTYTDHVNGATAAGVLFGAYHYARPDNNSAANEVSHFLSIAGNQVKAGFLRPMLDVENDVDPNDTVNTKAEISQWVNDWCNGVYNATGVKPIVYTYVSYASSWLDSTVTQWPLWMAQYPGSPNPQTGSPSGTAPWASGAWRIWQYSSTTAVPGISGNCDADVYNGDLTAFQNEFVITSPEVTVAKGAAGITDGQASSIDFGNANAGSTGPSITFTVKNDGGLKLNLSSLSVPSGYSITEGLSASLLPGASDTFTIQMQTASTGTKSGNISFTTNDPNENPFNFPITGTVVNPVPPPNAPTGLAISNYGSTAVTIGWADNSNNETQFLIERKTGAGGTYSQIGTVNADVVSFPDSGLLSGLTYYYRVRASSGGQAYSGYSNEVVVTTLPATPTNFAASDGSFTDRVSLAWSVASGATSYQLYRSTTNDPATADALATTTNTGYDDLTAAPGTTYFYWVAGRNTANITGAKSAGDSGFAADHTAPMIVDKWFDFTGALPTVNFKFSESVSGSIDQNSLSLTNLDGGPVPTVTDFSYSGANVATYTLNWNLASANYRAAVAGVTDSSNNSLTGLNTLDFSFLRGDANGNGVIDSPDFTALAAHFSQASANYVNGDFNNDGAVNALDFNLLAASYGQSLPAPPAAAPLGSLFSETRFDSPMRDVLA